MHEWKENYERNFTKEGKEYQELCKHSEVTWIFEEDSFVPCGKIKNNKKYSILADHLGTPTQMYNEEGESIGERSLDMNGKVQEGSHRGCPFLSQGQYYDEEIELAYNRFRYYAPEEGRYISKDPIGLASDEFNFYNYVDDPNGWIDAFGLHGNSYNSKKPNHVYVIYNKKTGEVHKFGISGGRIRRDGKSSRAESQARKLGPEYETKIISSDVSRRKAIAIEQGKVNAYSVSAQRNGSTGVGRSGVSRPANGPIGSEGNIRPTAKI